MKGTYRTALEWAKLLLSLDPEGDPYCMPLLIHHLALRAQEFQWLLDIGTVLNCETLRGDSGISLTTLPLTISATYAAMALRDGPGCRRYLTEAMNDSPWLFTRLFKELNLDAPKSIWGQQPQTDAETLVTELYVLQTKDLWNTPEATSLLMEIAHTIPKVDPDNCPKISNDEMSLNVVRFIYLDNTPSLMSLVPSYLLHRSNNSDADPLPPDQNIFSYAAQRIAIGGRDGARGDLGGDFLDPLAALARLLPGLRNAAAGDREGQEAAINAVLNEIVGGEHDRPSDEEEDDLEADRDVDAPPGVITRLLNMLWRSGNNVRFDGENDEEGGRRFNERERAAMLGEGTDDSLPELIGGEEGEGEQEADDEMPGLVDPE
jgi:hypothetical protein